MERRSLLFWAIGVRNIDTIKRLIRIGEQQSVGLIDKKGRTIKTLIQERLLANPQHVLYQEIANALGDEVMRR